MEEQHFHLQSVHYLTHSLFATLFYNGLIVIFRTELSKRTHLQLLQPSQIFKVGLNLLHRQQQTPHVVIV
jgi:hypothetical protein